MPRTDLGSLPRALREAEELPPSARSVYERLRRGGVSHAQAFLEVTTPKPQTAPRRTDSSSDLTEAAYDQRSASVFGRPTRRS